MSTNALTIDPDGWLTDVDLGDPDQRPEHLRRLIGCAAVHPILLAADLLMWAVDSAGDFLLNVAATDLVLIMANLPTRTVYGTVVCTGPAFDGVLAPIPAVWARYLAEHQAVRSIDAAEPARSARTGHSGNRRVPWVTGRQSEPSRRTTPWARSTNLNTPTGEIFGLLGQVE